MLMNNLIFEYFWKWTWWILYLTSSFIHSERIFFICTLKKFIHFRKNVFFSASFSQLLSMSCWYPAYGFSNVSHNILITFHKHICTVCSAENSVVMACKAQETRNTRNKNIYTLFMSMKIERQYLDHWLVVHCNL